MGTYVCFTSSFSSSWTHLSKESNTPDARIKQPEEILSTDQTSSAMDIVASFSVQA